VDLTFSAEDRAENVRRVAEVAALFADAGTVAIVALVSPFSKDRAYARSIANGVTFAEVFVDCPVSVCERRDPKGHYRQARAGLIGDFTGVSSPYEAPVSPDVHIHTATESIEQATDRLLAWLEESSVIPRK
jgi:adenylylsulfate kinase